MESIIKVAEKIPGVEVLRFENVEVEKAKNDQQIFSAVGPMTILYFKEFNRYVLNVNDWHYPLLRRLPASSSSQTDAASRTYTFAGLNGASYNVRILDSNNFALSNFETILKNQSNFGYAGENLNRKIEMSPDDKVVRTLKKEAVATTGYVSGLVTKTINKVKHLADPVRPGTKNLNSRKQMMKLSDIKNKNFRKEAKPTFKKDFFATGEKLSKDFMDLRTKNINNTQAREWTDLSKFTNLATTYFSKLEIENAILNNKDVATAGDYGAQGEPRKVGFIGNLKSGIEGIKGTVSGAIQNTRTGLNNLASDISSRLHHTQPTVQPADKSEGMTHYQG